MSKRSMGLRPTALLTDSRNGKSWRGRYEKSTTCTGCRCYYFFAVCYGMTNKPTQIDKARDRAVEIGRQFLDYEITVDEANDRLDSILVPETESGHGSIHLKADISTLQLMLLYVKNPYSDNYTYDDIKDHVDDMAATDYNE